jgi:hypothetical protein
LQVLIWLIKSREKFIFDRLRASPEAADRKILEQIRANAESARRTISGHGLSGVAAEYYTLHRRLWASFDPDLWVADGYASEDPQT